MQFLKIHSNPLIRLLHHLQKVNKVYQAIVAKNKWGMIPRKENFNKEKIWELLN
jgi:hypothetical protein